MTEESGPGSSGGRRRSLLRGRSVHQRVLRKARDRAAAGDEHDDQAHRVAKPSPDPAVEQPTLAEVITDRPPPVRGQAPATWDDLPPERIAAPEAAEPATGSGAGEASLDAGVDDPWFDAVDGTLEPAEERERTRPPTPVGAWLALGGIAAAVLLLIVAIVQGTTVSTAGPAAEVEVPAGWEQVQPELVGVADESADEAAPERQASAAPRAADAPAPEQARAAAPQGASDVPVDAAPAARPVAGDPLMQGADETDEPADAGPAEIPEGSADLWADLDRDDRGDDLWGHLAGDQE